MEIPLLKDILILFGLAIAVLLICHRLHVPTIVGFLLTGILAGPHGLGMISAVHEVEILAEIGIVLLLFTIGIEFSLRNLLQIRRSVLMGGAFQVLLTIMVTYLISMQIGLGFAQSVFVGFLVSLSSTAIVLKLIQERAEVDSPHGRTTLGILIFQDVIIVAMILVTPILAGAIGNLGESLLIIVAKGIGIILLVMVGAKWIVPQILYQIARTRNRELFLLGVVVICLAVAWMTSSAGLSLALGAFLAGLVISESEYSHQALGNILPFRDVFTSFFFVSIGMLLDVGFLFQRPGIIALIALCVLVLKSIIAGSVTILLGFPLRTGTLVGLALSQVGEFSFILSRTGIEHGLLAGNIYQMFLSVSVLTMAATPFIIAMAPRIADLALGLPLPKRLKSGLYPVLGIKEAGKTDHLIIIGFGVNGTNVARAARAGAISMYHIPGLTPEAPTLEKALGDRKPIEIVEIDDRVLEKTKGEMSSAGHGGEMDIVGVGCPHYTFDEVVSIARLLKGKKVKDGVQLWICTHQSAIELAKQQGIAEIIKEAGGRLFSGCLYCLHTVNPYADMRLMSDSGKISYYRRAVYGTQRECVAAAVSGRA
jgi:CPA2 family monovalent cation:H+ antiporter-2